MGFSKKRILLYSILVIVVVAGVGIYRFYKSEFLDATIPGTVHSQSQGLYKITYDTILVDEVAGSLLVNNIDIQVDTLFLSSDTARENPSVILNLHADTLRVSGVQTPRALLNNEIKGRRLLIKNASVELFKIGKPEKNSGDTAKGDFLERIYFDVIKQMKLVSMDTIILENIDLSYKDFKTKKLILKSTNVSLTLYDLLIDENTPADKHRIFFSKKVQIFADSIQLRDPKNHYDFRFNGLTINTGSQELKLNSASIRPLLGELAFVRLFKTQKDRFNFSFSAITIKGIDPLRLAIGELSADSLSVRKSSFFIYRDLRIPRDKVSRVGQYPHQTLMKIPFPVNIKQAFFNNSFIEYKEMNEKTNKAGKVQFNRVSAVMHNITNEPGAMRKNHLLLIQFSAWFLNMAKADVRLSMRIGDKQGRFSAEGKLGPFNAQRLNVLTEPMGLARIERGNVRGINFNMQGDNYRGDGELVLLYDKLRISSLKLEDDKSGYEKKGLSSLIANIIAINRNPSGGRTRKGSMSNERNTNRSFFNLIWKSIFTGVKETTGMDILGKQQKKKDKK